MTKDEMKNRISMALKDPILQQGFEIICKDLAISEHDREHNDYELTEVYKQVEELEKEKCELLGIIQGKDKAIFVLKKENAELKERFKRAKEIMKDYDDFCKHLGIKKEIMVADMRSRLPDYEKPVFVKRCKDFDVCESRKHYCCKGCNVWNYLYDIKALQKWCKEHGKDFMIFTMDMQKNLKQE